MSCWSSTSPTAGTWLAVGGPRSGRTTLLRTVLGEAVHRFGPDELHVHVIESGGGSLAADAAVLPHAGTTVAGEDALRTVRLIDRLGREVAARRAGPAPGRHPLILLLVDGVEALSTVLDDADPARGSAGLLRLLRDGAAVGLTCVATADRAVPGGRLAAAARQRLVLPLPDRADYAGRGHPCRGRYPSDAWPGGLCSARTRWSASWRSPGLSTASPLDSTRASARPFPPPVRITELPSEPVLALPTLPVAPPGLLALPIGPGGDEGDPLVVDLLRTGGLLVVGPTRQRSIDGPRRVRAAPAGHRGRRAAPRASHRQRRGRSPRGRTSTGSTRPTTRAPAPGRPNWAAGPGS